ncbi:MAG: Smr/MutS family protein [Deltaproteobacteria bacterium]|nr:Smr/MutS family protein [Deltaproteobacteria bacterium]
MNRRSKAGFNSPFVKLKKLNSKSDKKPTRATSESKNKINADINTNSNTLTTDESQIFFNAMSGVKSISHKTTRIEPQKNLERIIPDDEALALMELESLVRGESPFELTAGDEFISGVAPGVTHELLHSLKKGSFAFHRHLDLHGMHRDEAHNILSTFITRARADNERCVLIITGRGKSSPDGISILKEALPRWLSRAPNRPHVLAFCTALPVHGGPGAFYVLLRRPGVKPFGVQA